MPPSTKRLYLSVALKSLILVGVGFAMVPFVAMLTASDEHGSGLQPRAGSTDVDLVDIAPGRVKIVPWFGREVWIYRRRAEEIATLPGLNEALRDPNSERSVQPDGVRSVYRSAHPSYFVFLPKETVRGCEVSLYPADEPLFAGPNWRGGFAERCFGSRYDLAGRIYRDYGDERQTNLEVPLHWLLDDTRLRLGNLPTP